MTDIENRILSEERKLQEQKVEFWQRSIEKFSPELLEQGKSYSGPVYSYATAFEERFKAPLEKANRTFRTRERNIRAWLEEQTGFEIHNKLDKDIAIAQIQRRMDSINFRNKYGLDQDPTNEELFMPQAAEEAYAWLDQHGMKKEALTTETFLRAELADRGYSNPSSATATTVTLTPTRDGRDGGR